MSPRDFCSGYFALDVREESELRKILKIAAIDVVRSRRHDFFHQIIVYASQKTGGNLSDQGTGSRGNFGAILAHCFAGLYLG